MARNNKINYDIKEYISPIKRTDKHAWEKSVMKVQWGDNPVTLDIRNYNRESNVMGSGISLSDEEAFKVVDILLSNGYMDVDKVKELISKNEKMYEYYDKDVIYLNWRKQ